MIKIKQRLIIFIIIIGMITLGMNRIANIIFAENQDIVEKQNDDVSVSSDKTPTPDEYFEIGITSENPKEAKIVSFDTEKAEEDEITEVIIPETIDGYKVTELEDGFYGWKKLKSIELPSSITSIASSAFMNCTSLESVEILGEVEVIERSAFERCTSLESIIIPETVTIIEVHAFYRCISLKSINLPNSLISIGLQVFTLCSQLTTIIIPKIVTNIGMSAFASTGLTSITISGLVKEFGRGAFNNCLSLQSVTMLDPLESIGEEAFQYCENLTTVTLPNTLKTIGDSAFANCGSLSSIEIPDSVENIEQGAFRHTSLESIRIPDKVTSIEESTFYGCSQLATVTIPDTIKSIGGSAFAYCTSLETIVLPNTLEILAGNAFDDSAVNKLIFICQSIDNMKILDGVIGEFDGINIYRMAADNHLKARDDIIKSYEFIGQTMTLDTVFRYGVIYEGFIGEEEYTGNDIKLEDYFEMPTTEYSLQGNQTMADTKLIDNILYISQDEKSTDLSVIAESSNGEVLERPIQIILAESISIKEEPTKSIYDVGEEYKPDGLVITLTYEDNHEEDMEYSEVDYYFDFKHKELKFDTKEQEITYGRLTATHKLIVYGETTLRELNVGVTGTFSNNSELKIGKVEEDSMIYESLDDKEIIADYDIEIEGDYTRSDQLQIEFEIGNENNGKKVSIRHLKQDGNIEEFEGIVSEGKVRVEVSELSPFIIYTEKEIVEEPEIPDMPDGSKPVIKPIEPTPDVPVIRPNEPIPVKPALPIFHGNQSQPNVVPTEDNNHILLWGMIGMIGISTTMIFKKKNRINK